MRTVKARIGLLIDSEGKWSAIGFYKWKDSDTKAFSYEGLDNSVLPENFHFVEVEVPVPEVVQLEGKLEEDKNVSG